jgi:hypothetical protein
MTSKKDFTQVAHAVFVQAIGGAPMKTAKQLAGRKGGLAGGKTRMSNITDEEKARLSALGVAARKTPTFSGVGAGKVKKAGV